MKVMDFGLWQGANHSDSSVYREDSQRRHSPKDALSCTDIYEAGHSLAQLKIRRVFLEATSERHSIAEWRLYAGTHKPVLAEALLKCLTNKARTLGTTLLPCLAPGNQGGEIF